MKVGSQKQKEQIGRLVGGWRGNKGNLRQRGELGTSDRDGFHRNILICHFAFSTTLFGGIVSWKEFEKVFERRMRASGEWKVKSVQISSSLACRILGKCDHLKLATQLNIQFLWYTETQHLTSDSRHCWYIFQRRGGPWPCRWPLAAQGQQPCEHLGGFMQLPGLVLPWDELTWAGKRELSSHNCLKGAGDDWRIKRKTLEIHKIQSGLLLRKGSDAQQLSVFHSGPGVVLFPHTQSCLHPVCVCWGDFFIWFLKETRHS